VSNEFFKHSLLYFIAEAFNKGLVFITLPIFTFLLTPSEFGIMSIFTTITAILIVMMSLSSQQSVIRYYHSNEINFDQFLGSLIPLVSLFTICGVGLVYYFKPVLSSFINVEESVLVLASIVAFFGVFLQLELSYLQASKSSKTYTKILVLRNVLIIGFSVAFILSLEKDVYYGRFYSEALVGGLLFLFSIISLVRASHLCWNLEYIKKLLTYSLPLVISSLSGLLLLSSDVIFINNFLGSEKAGLYSFAFSVSMVIYVLISAINNAWLPFYYESVNEKKIESIQNVALLNLKIVLSFSFLVVIYGEYAVVLMAPDSYYESHVLIPIIAMGFVFLFLSNLFVSHLMYHKKTRIVAIFIMVAAIVNVGFNYLFIPMYGYFVAAWTTLLAYIILFILNFSYVLYFGGVKPILLPSILKWLSAFLFLFIMSISINISLFWGDLFFKFFLFLILVLLLFYKPGFWGTKILSREGG